MKRNFRKDTFYDFMASLAFVFNVDWDDEYDSEFSLRSEDLIEIPKPGQFTYKNAV